MTNTDKRQATTIELTANDKLCIKALSMRTGIITNIGILRWALRSAIEHDARATRIYDALTSPGVSAMEEAHRDEFDEQKQEKQ